MPTNQIDEGTFDALEIKLTNKLNGEVIEKMISNAWDAKELWIELSQNVKMMKEAIDKTQAYLDAFLGEDEVYKYPDGTTLRRVQRSTIAWRPETLRKFLDEDQIDVCLSVNKTTAKAIIKEMMEADQVPGNTIKVLDEEGTHVTSKPFLDLL